MCQAHIQVNPCHVLGQPREMHLPLVTESRKVTSNKPKATRFVMMEVKFKPIRG